MKFKKVVAMFLAIITFCCVKLNVAFADFEETEANISTEPNKTDEFAKVEEDIEQIKKAYDKAFTKQGKLDIVNTELEKVSAELEAHSRVKRGKIVKEKWKRDTVVFDEEKVAALNFKKNFLEKLQKGIGRTWKAIVKSLIKTVMFAGMTIGVVWLVDKSNLEDDFFPNKDGCQECCLDIYTEACKEKKYYDITGATLAISALSTLGICTLKAGFLILDLIF